MGARIDVEVWSDIVCPWCYIGSVRLAKAIASLADPGSVRLRTRSFELDPLVSSEPRPNLERLAEKYRVSAEDAFAMEERIATLAAEEGVPFEFERPSANSFDLHRMVWLAREFGSGEQLFTRLQSLFFGEGADVFAGELLVREAAAAGVPEDRATELLASDEYASEVRRDEQAARDIGITGVPFTVLSGRWAIPGAVASEQYREAIEKNL